MSRPDETSNDVVIEVANVDGSNVQRLGLGFNPQWSPDGTRIAFTGRYGGVWLMNADGTDRRMITTGNDPHWSPDGTRLVFSDHGIATIAADGTDRRDLLRLVDPESVILPPEWSPDGHQIAFSGAGSAAVYGTNVIAADGTGLRLVARVYFLAWSPDSRRVFLADGKHVVDLNTLRVTRPIRHGTVIAVSADWRLFAVEVDCGRDLNAGDNLFVTDARGQHRRLIGASRCAVARRHR